MWSYKKVISLGVLLGMFPLAGCVQMDNPFDTVLKPADSGQKTDADTASLKQFQDTSSDSPTAVESAIELSKKYAALSDEMSKLELEKHNIASENNQLKQRIATIEPELIQAQKELAEANDLLIEMRIELNNWKADVLGFRNEMREADKVQLETLVKILKVLGGEIKTDVPLEQGTQDKGK